jgi:hypothetical protein
MGQLVITLAFCMAVTLLLLAIGYLLMWTCRLRMYYSAIKKIFLISDEIPLAEAEDSLTVPIIVSSEFSYAIARFAADLIVRLGRSVMANPTGILPGSLTEVACLNACKLQIGSISSDSYGTYWIAYRGTSCEKEWKSNFNFNHSTFQPEGQPESYQCSRGFLSIYSEFRQDLIVNMNKLPAGVRVIVCGHSLGGTLATFTALDLKSRFPNMSVYTFGTPRTCNFPGTQDLANFYRMDNISDIVHQLPLAFMWNLSDRENPFKFQHMGEWLVFSKNKNDLGSNHTMPVYIEALENRELTRQSSVQSKN